MRVKDKKTNTTFVYDPDGNLVKKIKPDGSKTIYPSTTPQTAAASLRAGVGGLYEGLDKRDPAVDKTSGGSITPSVLRTSPPNPN